MADGSSIKTNGFIAYFDEEDGLAFQVASKIASPNHGNAAGASGDRSNRSQSSYAFTSPRRSAVDTLSALAANDAQKAVLPLQNDRKGYNKDALSALIDFHGHYDVVEIEEAADDSYVLAVPSAMVYELGESAFPSAYGLGAVGALPRNLQTQTALRRRIATVYATADAIDRCRPAIDGFRAQGIEVVRLPENNNPYRLVLDEAYRRLDPDREIETGFDQHTKNTTRTSKIRGANYGKGLVGVLLPSDVAWLGEGGDYRSDERTVTLKDVDYVIVDQGLAGAKQIETHHLVLSRKRPIEGASDKKKLGKSEAPADKIAGDDGIVAGLMAQNGFNTSRHVRVLLKVDTRGKGVADTAELTDVMNRGGLRHTPIVLNDRPDTLPTVFEIAVHSDADRKSLHKVLTRASNPAKGWHAKVLGCYASDRVMPDAPVAAKPMPAVVWVLLAGGFAMAGAIATYLLMS